MTVVQFRPPCSLRALYELVTQLRKAIVQDIMYSNCSHALPLPHIRVYKLYINTPTYTCFNI